MSKTIISEKLGVAVDMLKTGNYTLTLMHNDFTYTSEERGVKPLLSLIEERGKVDGAVAADKVIGKAAAMLYVKLGVSEVYADVISTPAIAVLKDAGISVAFALETEAIRNRRGDGFCPMESAVMNISDADDAITAIYETLKRLNSQK